MADGEVRSGWRDSKGKEVGGNYDVEEEGKRKRRRRRRRKKERAGDILDKMCFFWGTGLRPFPLSLPFLLQLNGET